MLNQVSSKNKWNQHFQLTVVKHENILTLKTFHLFRIGTKRKRLDFSRLIDDEVFEYNDE